jgi:hypothetical protein
MRRHPYLRVAYFFCVPLSFMLRHNDMMEFNIK